MPHQCIDPRQYHVGARAPAPVRLVDRFAEPCFVTFEPGPRLGQFVGGESRKRKGVAVVMVLRGARVRHDIAHNPGPRSIRFEANLQRLSGGATADILGRGRISSWILPMHRSTPPFGASSATGFPPI